MFMFEQVRTGNCCSYVIGCSEMRSAMIVDPVGDPNVYLDICAKYHLTPVLIVDTHTHADHVSLAPVLAERSHAKIVMHPTVQKQRNFVNMAPTSVKPILDRNASYPVKDFVTDGQRLAVGEVRVTFMYTPGHTEDSICLLVENKLLTGDTLHIGGVGRTDLPGGNPAVLFESIATKILALGPDMVIYPGHDSGKNINSSLGYEVINNPFLKPSTKEEFVKLVASCTANGKNRGENESGISCGTQKSTDSLGTQSVLPVHLEQSSLQSSAQLSPLASVQSSQPPAQVSPSFKETMLTQMAQAFLQNGGKELRVTVEELKQELDSGKKVLILDVRSEEEVKQGRIPGAIPIPLPELFEHIEGLPDDADMPIVTVCARGGRSAVAFLYLRAMKRYRNIRNLDGGTMGWVEAGFQVER